MIPSTPLTASSKPPSTARSPTTTTSTLSAVSGLALRIASPLASDLAVTRTRKPRRSRSSRTCAPTKPVAPVTRISWLEGKVRGDDEPSESHEPTHSVFMTGMVVSEPSQASLLYVGKPLYPCSAVESAAKTDIVKLKSEIGKRVTGAVRVRRCSAEA